MVTTPVDAGTPTPEGGTGSRVVLRPMGERAVLAEVADLDGVVALHAALAAEPAAGVEELVPAARTVLVAFDPRRIGRAAVREWIHRAAVAPADIARPGPLVEVPVRYDGADLDETAAILGIRAVDLAARHAGVEWTVAFTGFAPGFAYLVSAEWPFDVPRLAQPRTRVPAGAVGLAGTFSGAYPRETPGGWRLIGTADAVLFDPDAAAPVLLPPRARVRFTPQRERVISAASSAAGLPTSTEVPASADAPAPTEVAVPAEVSQPVEGTGSLAPPPFPDASTGSASSVAPARPRAALRVLDPGAFTTVQDLGRPARADLGVARSGALDRAALRVANRLVGNDERAAGLEIALGGVVVRAEAAIWVCVTGAFVDVVIDDRAVDAYAPQLVPAGAVLRIGSARAGLRVYLATRGGIIAPSALGSRSRDVLAGLGPAPVRAGDVLEAGVAASAIPVVDAFPWTVPPALHDVAITEGPRADWFAADAWTTLLDAHWTASGDVDRVGARLDGPALDRIRNDELPSEGMRPGAIQVPPHGRPVVLLADGPVTGGYPVIAVVTDAALDALAQVRPGDRVRFRRV
ncbi:sensor histidine kinase inhibitor, KipI family [Microbacterium sp. ru370.1]|uniref:urea amidolyase family protein n=1 Tax=unclassified Microbacterium TaxID=2609290 RepID=UPI0008923FBA|nr:MULTISPECIES: urea amidolyase family protein [unclassified Microbacterium]SDO44225.1 sensor histidine kinase inhibitor, KipI family [Microbacterium sp. ru370.1]SIT80924.1 sensor histidine kinase inhibitor, KipI family [Microbacterium sp. RU1D]